jgi:hypothetical protein
MLLNVRDWYLLLVSGAAYEALPFSQPNPCDICEHTERAFAQLQRGLLCPARKARELSAEAEAYPCSQSFDA